MSEIAAFIKLIPVLFALVRSIQKAIDDAQTNKEVADHLSAIKKAFDEKDASALNSVFNQ